MPLPNFPDIKEIKEKAEAKMIAASMNEYFESEDYFIQELESAYANLVRKSGYDRAREITRGIAERAF